MKTDNKNKENKVRKTKIIEGKSVGNNKIVATKRPKVSPASQKQFLDAYNASKTEINGGDVKVDYAQVVGLDLPLSGNMTNASSSGFTYCENNNVNIKNNSGNTTIVDLDKFPFATQEYPNNWPLSRIIPTEDEKVELMTFLNSIESELIALNSKIPMLSKGSDTTLDCMTLHELFEIKKHLGETVFKNHFPGSTGNIHMITAQRRFDIIENEINNKLNVLFKDV